MWPIFKLRKFLAFQANSQLPVWLVLFWRWHDMSLAPQISLTPQELWHALFDPVRARRALVPHFDGDWLELANAEREKCSESKDPFRMLLRWILQHPKVRRNFHVKAVQREIAELCGGLIDDDGLNLMRSTTGWCLLRWTTAHFIEFGDAGEISINCALAESDFAVLLLRTAHFTLLDKLVENPLPTQAYTSLEQFLQAFCEFVCEKGWGPCLREVTDELLRLTISKGVFAMSNVTLWGPRAEIKSYAPKPSATIMACAVKYSPFFLAAPLWKPLARFTQIKPIKPTKHKHGATEYVDTWWNDTINSQQTICMPIALPFTMSPIKQSLHFWSKNQRELLQEQDAPEQMIDSCMTNANKNAFRMYVVDGRPAVKEHTLDPLMNERDHPEALTVFRFIDLPIVPSVGVINPQCLTVRPQNHPRVEPLSTSTQALSVLTDPWHDYVRSLYSYASDTYFLSSHLAVHNVVASVQELLHAMPWWVVEGMIIWFQKPFYLDDPVLDCDDEKKECEPLQPENSCTVKCSADQSTLDPYGPEFGVEQWKLLQLPHDFEVRTLLPVMTDAREIMIGVHCVFGQSSGTVPEQRHTRPSYGNLPKLAKNCSYLLAVWTDAQLYEHCDAYCFLSEFEYTQRGPVLMRDGAHLYGVMDVHMCQAMNQEYRWLLEELFWFDQVHCSARELPVEREVLLVMDHDDNLIFLASDWNDQTRDIEPSDVVMKWPSELPYRNSKLWFI